MNRRSSPLVAVLLALPLLALALWGTARWTGVLRPAGAPAAAAPRAAASPEPDDPGEPARVEDGGSERRSQAPTSTEPGVDPAVGQASSTRLLARVVDAARRAIGGARLTALRPEGQPTAESDAEGRVVLALDPASLPTWRGSAYPTRFALRAEGYATRFLRAAAPAGVDTDLGEIVLDPGGAIAGRVVDEAGAPVAGASVVAAEPALGATPAEARLRGPGESDGREEATTGEDGSYRLPGVVAGTARLWGRRVGSAWAFSDPLEVLAGTDTPAPELVLPLLDPAQRIAGVVLDPAGAPVEGAPVVAHALVEGPIRSSRTESGADGRFELAAIADAAHTVKAFDPAGELRATYAAGVRPGATGVELRLVAARWMQVTVVDDQDGQPLEDPWVFLEDRRDVHFLDGLPEQRKVEQGPGVVRLTVPQARFEVAVSAPGYRHAREGPFEPEAAPAELEVRLERQPMVRGRVLAGGEPVAGAWVELLQVMGPDFPILSQGFRTRLFNGGGRGHETDDEGRFEVPADFGDYEIGHALLAGKDGWATAELRLELTPQGMDDVELTLTPGGVLEGAILLPAGRDAHGALVAASRGDGRVIDTRADGDGRYRFEHLTPGPWELEYRAQAQQFVMSVAGEPFEGPYTGDCVVHEGRTTVHDLDQRGSATRIQGRLTLDGRPPGAGWSARLEPVPSHGLDEGVPSVLLDAEGRYTLEGEGDAARLVLESAAGGAHLELRRVLALTGDLLEPTLDLVSGRLRGSAPAGETVSVVRDELEGWTFEARVAADGQGTFRLEAVPAGALRLRRRVVTEGGWNTWVEGPAVEVPAGGEATAGF